MSIDINLIIGIIQEAATLLGPAVPGAQLTASLIKIYRDVAAAHQQHTGEPLNPDFLKPFEPI